MRALCWHGKSDIRCCKVADPEIRHDRDVIIKVTACAICGTDRPHVLREAIWCCRRGGTISMPGAPNARERHPDA